MNPRIESVASAQHGVATRAQFLAAGASRHALDHRVRSGRLIMVHRGVYRLATEPPTIWALAMAAVLAVSRGGRGSAVSHTAAAALWEFPGRDPPDAIDVTGTAPRRVQGVRVHRVRSLCSDEVTALRGVPLTTRARTILDLAGTGTTRELEQALAAAVRADRRQAAKLRRLLQRHPRHAGSGRLRLLLGALDAAREEPLFLRSQAEERMLRMARSARLPPFRTNTRIAGLEVDFVWPAQRVIVEVDGYSFHGSAPAFHRDRDRDCTLAAHGYQVLRFAWRQLTEEPYACLAALCMALGARMP
jgi:very-short-patch-repair endonuclease